MTTIAVTTEPKLIVRAGKVYASSREVSLIFGKRHDNVLRDIDNLSCSLDFKSLNFEEVNEINHLGQNARVVMLTRNGFTLLAFGFTGSDAVAFKEGYLAQFDKMEATLQNIPAEMMNDPIIKMRLEQIEMDKRITKLETMLPAPTTHMTVMGYANARGISIDTKRANVLGRRAAALTNMRGLIICPVPDDRYGTVNSYPLSVLEEVLE